MKITKNQLRKLIKEEIANVLSEDGVPPTALGLPHDVGSPDKLLAGIQALLSSQEGPLNDPPQTGSGWIANGQARLIIKLINGQLKKNPDEKIKSQLQDAKIEIMRRDPDQFEDEIVTQMQKARHKKKALGHADYEASQAAYAASNKYR